MMAPTALGWSRKALGLAWIGACAAACVPRGDPPAGRQLVADRVSTLAGIVRPNGDGVTRVLLTRPGQDAQSADLYVVSAGAAGGPPSERLLAANIEATYNGNCQLGVPGCFRSDARGRVFVATSFDPDTGYPTMARLDPVTAERLELGVGVSYELSPSGERFIVLTPARELQSVTLYDPDDHAVSLGETNGAVFVGEDLYYVTAQHDLMRIAAGGAPELLASGVSYFAPQTTEGDLLLLARANADPTATTYSFLDTVTLEETASPLGSTPFTTSFDGRWLLAVDIGAGRGTFVERATGAEEVFDISALPGINYEWRPGHDEVWFLNGGFPQPSILIEKPGAPSVTVAALAYAYMDDSHGSSLFTRDGGYWFSSRAPLSAGPIMQVGSADDPAGERFDLAPAGTTSDSYWRLADGRILAPAFIRDRKRNDLYAVDPATGDSRVLGQEGLVAAVGRTRLLASLRVNDSRGDLTAIDLETGQSTVLAPEFALQAFVEQQSVDAVAPGAAVAFQFQARFASPFDGVWLATVP
jgi:hypothetical protein